MRERERDVYYVLLGFFFWCLLFLSKMAIFERERRLLLSWAKAGKDSKGRSKPTRSEGADIEESAARALMRHGLERETCLAEMGEGRNFLK